MDQHAQDGYSQDGPLGYVCKYFFQSYLVDCNSKEILASCWNSESGHLNKRETNTNGDVSPLGTLYLTSQNVPHLASGIIWR
jgi:hypothetical protein